MEKSKITISPLLTREDSDNTIAEINAKIKMLHDMKSLIEDKK